MSDNLVTTPSTPPPPFVPAVSAAQPASVIKPPVAPAAPVPAKPKTSFTIVEPKETPAKTPAPPPPAAPGAEKVVAATDGKEIIPRAGVLTIVMVTTTGTPAKNNMNAVTLPKDAIDLDVVEVHRAIESTGVDVAVYPNKGEAIGDLPVSDGTFNSSFARGVSSAKPVSFRKMSKSLWAVIS